MSDTNNRREERPLEVKGLTRLFGKTTALKNVDLSVARGRVLGLVGENGAGKTTIIKHLMGLLKPQEGSVRVFGIDPVKDPTGALGRIGYLSEERDLPHWMRVDDDVAMIHRGEIVMCASLEAIKSSHHFLTLRFPEPVREKPKLPGALSIEGDGREWTVLSNGDPGEVRAKARAMGCEIFEEPPPTLEDIFVARVGVDRSILREGEECIPK